MLRLHKREKTPAHYCAFSCMAIYPLNKISHANNNQVAQAEKRKKKLNVSPRFITVFILLGLWSLLLAGIVQHTERVNT